MCRRRNIIGSMIEMSVCLSCQTYKGLNATTKAIRIVASKILNKRFTELQFSFLTLSLRKDTWEH